MFSYESRHLSQSFFSYLVFSQIAYHLSPTQLIVCQLHNSCCSCFCGCCDDSLYVAAPWLYNNYINICHIITQFFYPLLRELPFFYKITTIIYKFIYFKFFLHGIQSPCFGQLIRKNIIIARFTLIQTFGYYIIILEITNKT